MLFQMQILPLHNGVLPIDRLTDVRQPVAIVAERVSRDLFESTYKLKLPLPALHEDQRRKATAGEVLRAYSAARGLTVQHGRPDEQRAGRAILKDFINGKLLFCVGPKGYMGKLGVDGGGGAIGEGDGIGDTMELVDEDGIFNAGGALGPSGNAGEYGNGEGGAGAAGGGEDGDAAALAELEGLALDDPLAAQLLEEMMNELGGLDGKGKPKPEKQKRAEHKYQKKSKIKGRIKNAGVGEVGLDTSCTQLTHSLKASLAAEDCKLY